MLEHFFFVPFILGAIIIAFYVPGRVVFGQRKAKNKIIIFACSVILGMVLWGWQGYIFGYLHVRFLSYVYLLFFIFIFILRKYYIFNLKKHKNIDFLAVFLVILGTFAQVAPYYKMGLITGKGIYIPPFNYATDHIAHTSMIAELVKRFPPYEPGMYGAYVTNYHYWFNLVTAELIRVFHLPLFQTQYIGMYVFGSVMLGITAYVFSTSIIKSRNFVRWLLFFLYFGGDATYWLSFITAGRFDFQVPSIIENSTLFMDNPTRAFSVIILFVTLYLIFRNLKEITKIDFVIISILAGTLVGFRVYAGLAALSGLGLLALYNLAFRRDWKIVGVFILSCIFSLIVFVPVNANSGGIFFNPVDRPRDFITYQPLGLNDWEMRWRLYLLHNNYIRLIQYGIMMSVVYFFAQFGIRLIGIIPYKKMLLLLDHEKKIFIYGTMFFLFLIGLFFNQAANPAESYNFFITGAFFLTILTALNLTQFLDRKNLFFKLIIILLIVGITIPRWIYVHKNYLSQYVFPGSFYGVTNEEVETYNFLRNVNQNSLILVLNKNNFDRYSPLVNTLTDKNMFLSGQRILEDHNSINKDRFDLVDRIRNSNDSKMFVDLLKKHNINYLYLYKNDKIRMNLKNIDKYKVFENKIAIIYKL